jgi:hypothetical protein
MGKKTREIGRLIAEMASRYGDDDEDVGRLRLELAALESVTAIHKEIRETTTKKLPLKETARKRYLKSVSVDSLNH